MNVLTSPPNPISLWIQGRTERMFDATIPHWDALFTRSPGPLSRETGESELAITIYWKHDCINSPVHASPILELFGCMERQSERSLQASQLKSSGFLLFRVMEHATIGHHPDVYKHYLILLA